MHSQADTHVCTDTHGHTDTHRHTHTQTDRHTDLAVELTPPFGGSTENNEKKYFFPNVLGAWQAPLPSPCLYYGL